MKFLIFIVFVGLNLFEKAETKIVNFGPKLTEYIEQHPDKSWLIKFYVPWCYHCQQLEPVFLNVAEHIYHRHDNLIVGRVDCTKYGSVCDKYEVRSYPKIAYLNQNTHIAYKGDRSEKSMIEFAERLNGPNVHTLDSCDDLRNLADRKGLIILYILSKESNGNKLYDIYKSIAGSLKARYWFYQVEHLKYCRDLNLTQDNIYIFKRDLDKAFKFGSNYKEESDEDKFKVNLSQWLEMNSIPIYGQVGSGNLDQYLSSSRPLVLALLDLYQPAKRFSKSSEEFNDHFRKFVKKFVQQDRDQIGPLFGWTSDLELVSGIVIGQVAAPNVIVLQPNYTFHMFIDNEKDLEIKIPKTQIPKSLAESNLKITLKKLDQLTYQGGNSYVHSLMRQIYGQYNTYTNMYRANPLLASILVGLPSIILVFVIYTTCCYDSQTDYRGIEYESSVDDEADSIDADDEERQRLLENSHLKQE